MFRQLSLPAVAWQRLALASALSFFAATLLTATAWAQPGRSLKRTVEITPMALYAFEGNFDDGFGFDRFDIFDDVEVDEGTGYGINLGFGISRTFQLEFSYSEQETELVFDGFLSPEETILDLDVQYLHVNAVFQFPSSGQIEPFVFVGGGITNFEPTEAGFDDDSQPSFGFGGGVKFFVNDNFGFRVQGRLLGTYIDDDDDEVFCDDFGCFGYDDETYLYQAEASAGLIIAF
ncbi:MAG: outer membrane beta-barrel protein [Acidobacteriota bacterium]